MLLIMIFIDKIITATRPGLNFMQSYFDWNFIIVSIFGIVIILSLPSIVITTTKTWSFSYFALSIAIIVVVLAYRAFTDLLSYSSLNFITNGS